jgi:hypothetical protein
MTVDELLSKADTRELTEWMAYFQIENEKNKGEDSETVTDKVKAGFAQFKDKF